jgi:multicomponent Na+:H+ antiporter subunit G
MIDAVSSLLIVAGLGFYLAGSIGLLRLPDLYSRLHALTKADNLGLGLLTAGLALHSQQLLGTLKLLLIWLAVLAASAASAHLIAQHARRRETRP